jgi:ligand-binding sensor domain-containing protein
VRARTFALAVDRSGRAYAGTGNGAVWTTGGDGRWRLIGDLRGRATALLTDGHGALYFATTWGLWKTADGGVTWRSLHRGIGKRFVGALATDPRHADRLYAGTDANGVFQSEDGGETWEAYSAGLRAANVAALAISPDGLRVYAGTVGHGVAELRR